MTQGLRITEADWNSIRAKHPGAVVGKSLMQVLDETPTPKQPKKRIAYRNKWESLMAVELADDLAAGRIVWWAYESMRLLIARTEGESCWYKTDFVVLHLNGTIEAREIKGFKREAARIRFIAAAERYPWIKFRMVKRVKNGWQEMKP